MSQHGSFMLQQPQHNVKGTLLRHRILLSRQNVEKNYRKNVATHKFMSQQNEELKVEIFVGSYVTTLIKKKLL